MGVINIGGLLEGTAYGVINEVLGNMRQDIGHALPSRFEITLHPPSGARGKERGTNTNLMSILMPRKTSEGTTRETSLRCESIEFPGRTLDTTPDTNLYGPIRDIVNGYSYGDVTATFQMSQDLREKTFFETWQRLAYDNRSWHIEYYDSYTGSIDIHQLDINNNKRYGVQLIECFPKTIAAMPLTAAPATEISKLSVTFSYRYWKNLTDESEIPKPLLDRIGDIVVNGVEREIRSAIPRVLSKL